MVKIRTIHRLHRLCENNIYNAKLWWRIYMKMIFALQNYG